MTELRYYSNEEVAEILGVSTRTIYNYLVSGKLRGYKVGGAWKFKAQDIDDFVTSQEKIPQYKPSKED